MIILNTVAESEKSMRSIEEGTDFVFVGNCGEEFVENRETGCCVKYSTYRQLKERILRLSSMQLSNVLRDASLQCNSLMY